MRQAQNATQVTAEVAAHGVVREIEAADDTSTALPHLVRGEGIVGSGTPHGSQGVVSRLLARKPRCHRWGKLGPTSTQLRRS